MTEDTPLYNKSHPFLASIIERYNLCAPGSDKDTCHVVLDLKGSGLTYRVGDSIAVYSINDQEVVDKTLMALGATGTEKIIDKNTSQEWLLRDFFIKKANLTDVPRKLITEFLQKQTDPKKQERFTFLMGEGQKDALKEYQASHEIWDALEENREVLFTPQELCNLLMPLLPRFYSISSSMLAVGDEVHLTVSELKYETNGHQRHGVCTHFLCRLAPLKDKVVPIYLQASHGFTLPEDLSTPIIMVGPGTGVAPFRAFLQERVAQGATGMNWLIFGERHQAFNYYYEDYWQELVDAGKLRLDTAFSRDQEHKIYVQHRLLEHGAEIFALLEKNAMFYVCGDAHRMAKDVDAALHYIVQKYGPHDEQSAKNYIKQLKAQKRYLRDVY